MLPRIIGRFTFINAWAGAVLQGPCSIIHMRRDAAETGFERPVGEGEKPDYIGKQYGDDRAGQDQPGADAECTAHEAVDRVVERAERKQDSDGKHCTRYGIA